MTIIQQPSAITADNLTAKQINALTATMTGKPAKRAATKADAIKRFIKEAEAIFETGAYGQADFILNASGFEVAQGNLQIALEEHEEQVAELDGALNVVETSEGETGFWAQTDEGPVWTAVQPEAPAEEDDAPLGQPPLRNVVPMTAEEQAEYDAVMKTEAPEAPAKPAAPRRGAFAGKSFKVNGGADAANPYRPSSKSFEAFKLVQNNPGINFEEFLAKGGRVRTLQEDVKAGRIREA